MSSGVTCLNSVFGISDVYKRQSLFIRHEGRKVEIKDNSMREWKEIRLEDGKVGWVPASSIEGI